MAVRHHTTTLSAVIRAGSGTGGTPATLADYVQVAGWRWKVVSDRQGIGWA